MLFCIPFLLVGCKTYVVPNVSFETLTSDTNSISYQLKIEDPSQAFTLKEVCLYLGDQKVRTVSEQQYTFTNLYSGIEYEIVVDYSYNVKKKQTVDESYKEKISTVAYQTPTVSFKNITSTRKQITYELDLQDPDNLVRLDVVSLLLDGVVIAKNYKLTDQVFASLLANHSYELKLEYHYDLNDGQGIIKKSMSQPVSTTSVIAPTLEITNLTPNETDVTFDIARNEPDEPLEIMSIELYAADTKVAALTDFSKLQFENLYADHDYQIIIQYCYDLEDGNATIEKTLTKDFHTKKIDAPVISWKGVQGASRFISFDYEISATKANISIQKISLYQAENLIDTITVEEEKYFDGLLSNHDYELVLDYQYDLLDGSGVHDGSIKKTVHTEAMTAPTISYDNELVLGDKDAISYGFNIQDPSQNLKIIKTELYDGTTLIQTNDGDKFRFENLLSVHSYTIKTYCEYDLNDGSASQSIVITADVTTTNYRLPVVTLSDVTASHQSVSFGVDIVDEDAILSISYYAVYDGEEEVQRTDLVDEPAIDGLLSNHDYTLKIFYSYDLHDGNAPVQKVISKEFTTLSYENPDFSISLDEIKKTEIFFTVLENDEHQLGSVTSVILKQAEQQVQTLENMTGNSFSLTQLLSNTDYTMEVVYTYDLCDGSGSHEISKTIDFKTLNKERPTLSVQDLVLGYEEISFDYLIDDIEGICVVDRASILDGTNIIQTTTTKKMTGLLSNHDYTLVITYHYDLNDGQGNIEETFETPVKTLERTVPTIEFVNVGNTLNRIYFDLAWNNPTDAVVTLTSVRLGSQTPIQTTELTGFIFEALASNTDYLITVSYEYDLHDGNGLQQGTSDQMMKTQAVEPVVEITSIVNTISYIEYTYEVSDPNEVCQIDSLTLNQFKDGEMVEVARMDGGLPTGQFRNLIMNQEYILVLTYSFDLNDSSGKVTRQITKYCNTYPFTIEIEAGQHANIASLHPTATFVEIPNEVMVEGKTYPVSKVLDEAALNHENLSSLKIQPGITLGTNAFVGTNKLSELSVSYDAWLQFKDWQLPRLKASLMKLGLLDGSALVDSELEGFTALKSVELADSILTIGKRALMGCEALENVSLSQAMTSIDDEAFMDCIALKSIVFSDTVSHLGVGVFKNCTKLASVVLPNNEAFNTIPNDFFYHSGIESLCLSDSITAIGESAYEGTALTEVDLPSRITDLGRRAFKDCRYLTIARLGDSIETINEEVFSGCRFLRDIVYADGVTTVLDKAFYGCQRLTYLVVPSPQITFVGDSVTEGSAVLGLYLKCSKEEEFAFTYQDANGRIPTAKHYYYSEIAPTELGINDLWHYKEGIPTVWPLIPTIRIKSVTHTSSTVSFKAVYDDPNKIGILKTAELVGTRNRYTLDYPALTDEFSEVASNQQYILTLVYEYDMGDGILKTTEATSDPLSLYQITYLKDETNFTCVMTGVTDELVDRLEIPSEVVDGNQTYQVVGIHDHACTMSKKLKTVVIPDTITSIGKEAFYGCVNLFEVIIGNGITTISEGAFSECSSLMKITIGKNVNEILANAFRKCSSLTEIRNLSSLNITLGSTEYGELGLYASSLILDEQTPSQLIESQDCIWQKKNDIWYLIRYLGKTTELALPSSITLNGEEVQSYWIGSRAFVDSTLKVNVTLPDSVVGMESAAFKGSGIVSVRLPQGLTTIPESCFEQCTDLKSVTWVQSIKTIGRFAFSGCRSLVLDVLPSEITSIGDEAFKNCEKAFTILSFSNQLKTIGIGAFYGIATLQYVQFNSGLEVDMQAFAQCSQLKYVVLQNSAYTFDGDAFMDSSLVEFYFYGTQEEFNDLQLVLDKPVYYYSATPAAGCWHYDQNYPVKYVGV